MALDEVLRASPSAQCLVALDEAGHVLASAGGQVGADAGPAAARLWAAARRAARSRSPSPLDHLVLRTTVGDAAVVRAGDLLLAATGRPGTRPDQVAYELRRAAARLVLPSGAADGVEQRPGSSAASGDVAQ